MLFRWKPMVIFMPHRRRQALPGMLWGSLTVPSDPSLITTCTAGAVQKRPSEDSCERDAAQVVK